MNPALLIVFATGVLVYVVFGLGKKLRNTSTSKPDTKDCSRDDVCGVSCFCDEKSLELQMSEDIVYFDDEELDAYKGISAEAYNEKQIEEFSEVLTTLKPDEIPEWLHSLQLRGISLPVSLKDEALLMME